MPITIAQLQKYKLQHRPIVALTATDYAIAKMVDQAEVDLILVGDSLAMVALGHPNTLPLTLEQTIHHTQAVGRAVSHALLVVDLPFLSYQISPEQAILAAGSILQQTPAQAVKLEGASPRILHTVERLTEVGIPVIGHLGLTPQSVYQLGYRQQATTPAAATDLLTQAQALTQAGIFALVLEHIPSDLAAQVTQALAIPTIGIGAGHHCDGQILVTHDLLGLSDQIPPFAKQYANLREIAQQAIAAYSLEVRRREFPS
ncbi:MAG: 3-methyl-2-oxobutanoate hydroxymethyltransferase [Pseudanabaenaceae cyanobacterium bins.68]|nr:3-methyl-2-oxobutanoate hydroxymethyltransferase [Pseudanabaenaceae cyanobacterium bins.68]